MSPKIRCPYCGSYESKVKDIRPNLLGVHRRRECQNPRCHKRFNTQEVLAQPQEKFPHHNM